MSFLEHVPSLRPARTVGRLTERIRPLGRSGGSATDLGGWQTVWLLLAAAVIAAPIQPATTSAASSRSSKNMSAVTVTGVLGRSVLLPCNTSASLSDTDRVVLILWYKEGIDTPIYSVDGRDTEITKGGHWSSEAVLGRRASFMWPEEQLQSTSVGLLLTNIILSDESVYRCRIDFKEAQTRNLLVNLSIIVPPSAPVIKNELDVVVPSVAGPYLEGHTLKLVCESNTGRPPASVSWYRNGELWDTTYEVAANGTVRNEMALALVRRSDVNTILSCEASNNIETAPVSSFVLVDLLLAPLAVTLHGAENVLAAYNETNFTCQSTGSRPPPITTWFIGDQRLLSSVDSISHDGNVSSSVLTYRPSVEDQGKQIKCRVENLKLPVSPLEISSPLQLKYLPQVSVVMSNGGDRNNITEGRDVFLHCNVQAMPSYYKIEWKLNGETLVSNSTAGVSAKANNLVIRRISSSHSGAYTCQAWNSLGSNQSEPFHVDVFSAPVCSFTRNVNHYVNIGDAVQLPCNVSSHPRPVSYQWTLKRPGHYRELASNSSVLLYSAWSTTDFGILQCKSTNSAGKQQEPCTFVIKPTGPPDAPASCKVQTASTHSVQVACRPGSDHGSNQSFAFVIFNRTHYLVHNVTTTEPVFTAESLEPGREYLASVYAFNSKGRSPWVNLTLHSIHEPLGQPTIAESGDNRTSILLTPTISTVISVCAAAMSLLLIAMGVFCRLKYCQVRSQSAARTSAKNGPSSVTAPDMDNSYRSHRIDADRVSDIDDIPLMPLSVTTSVSCTIHSNDSRPRSPQCPASVSFPSL